MKKFIITGLPRSGTTVVCRTIANNNDVYMYKNGNGWYEPFSTFHLGHEEFNPHGRLHDAEKDCNLPYFGFKLFAEDLITVEYCTSNGYVPFAVIRQDIWKAVFSHWNAEHNLANDKVCTFDKSSKDYTLDRKNWTSIDAVPRETLSRIVKKLIKWTKWAYRFEKIYKANIIYFEDITKQNALDNSLNEFFDRDITFNLNYTDDHGLESYAANVDTLVWSEISKMVAKEINLPSDTPQYIKNSLTKYSFS